MKPSPLVDIYILNTNARKNVRVILRKLAKLAYPKNNIRITVCDNNSTDGSKKMLAEEFPKVHIVALKKNHGMSALNFGFKKRKGQYCFVLDDDSYFEKDAISQALREFEHDEALGILACHAIGSNGESEYKYMPKSSASIRWCDFLGGGVVIRGRVFDDVGYFNPDILIYGHEVDFSLRALDAGWGIKFAPHIRVYRLTPPNKMNAFRMSLGVRNFPSVFFRFLSFPRATGMSLVMLTEYLVIAVRSKTVMAYIKGVWGFMRNVQYIVQSRKQVRREVEDYWSTLYPFAVGNTWRRVLRRYRISTV